MQASQACPPHGVQVREVLAEEKLEALPLQIRKVMQFHEACQQRMGVVVVGPSGCGKSMIWKLLLKANAKLGRKIPTCAPPPPAASCTTACACPSTAATAPSTMAPATGM